MKQAEHLAVKKTSAWSHIEARGGSATQQDILIQPMGKLCSVLWLRNVTNFHLGNISQIRDENDGRRLIKADFGTK